MLLKSPFRLPFSVLTTLIAIATTLPAPLAAQTPPLVIASGLDNPRGLAFGPDGALYVVEAGRGGNSSLCLPEAGAPPTAPPRCYGPTGAVTRVSGVGVQERVVTGLPSLAGPSGQATGPHDIQFDSGNAFLTIGFGGNPSARAPFVAAGIGLGTLVKVLPNGQWSYVLDLSIYEATANPDGGAIDTNPYGLLVRPDRGVFTDAGGNALLKIDPNGTISTLAVFPDRMVPGPTGALVPMQAVPTSVTLAPDGNYYVGQLTGFPFPIGGAQVFRVPPQGGTPEVVATGFTNIIDVLVDRNGVGYVLEHDLDGVASPGQTGQLTRVARDGTRTVLSSTLIRPGGLALGPDGAIYVSNRSISAGTGEVLRFAPVP